MTSAEIVEKEFPTGLRGYKQDEVNSFLETVSQEWQAVEGENEALRRQVQQLSETIKGLERREQSLNQSIAAIEKTRAESREIAQREAELIRSQARVEGEKFLRQAEMRRQMLMEEIRSLEVLYARLRSRLKVIVDTFTDLLKTPEELREEIRIGMDKPGQPAGNPPEGTASA